MQISSYMPELGILSFVLAAVLCVLAVYGVLRKPRFMYPIERSGAGWLCLFAAIAAAFGAVLKLDLYTGPTEIACAFLVIVALCGLLTLLRCSLTALIARRSQRVAISLSILRDAVLLAAACGLSFLALELPWNDMLPLENTNGFIFELSLIGLVLLILYLIAQRRGAGPAIGIIVCAFIGIAEAYVIKFKGTTIRPGDLYSLGTALAVAGNYDYSFGLEPLLGLSCAVGALGLVSLIVPYQSAAAQEPSRIASSGTRFARFAVAAALVVGMVGTFMTCNLRSTFGIAMTYWDSLTTVKGQGFLTGFLVGVQDLAIRVPEKYSTKLAEETRTRMAARWDSEAGSRDTRKQAISQFDEEAPSIVVVMNEAFSDLSDLGADRLHYEGPIFFTTGDPRPLKTGQLAVSVLGGGTCNSEFEFLTGVSMAFVGSGKYPYAFYDLTRCGSLVTQLEDLGYATTGIHPGNADNWNRAKAYESFGFDEFISISGFPKGANRYHRGVTDAETYKQVLKRLSDTSSPQFIFNVTMQGHSDYDPVTTPTDYREGIVPEGFSADDGVVSELNVYLDSVDHSDADLEVFVNQLMELDRKVVLVFFGDHKPRFASDYNDAYFEDEDYIPHVQRTHHSNYAIWANYDIAGQGGKVTGTGGPDEPQGIAGDGSAAESGDSAVAGGTVEHGSIALNTGTLEVADSADVLAARVLELIGAPLTDFQKARLLASADIAQLNYFGYQDNDGAWHPIWDEELEEGEQQSDAARAASEALYDLSLVEYLEFGSKY